MFGTAGPLLFVVSTKNTADPRLFAEREPAVPLQLEAGSPLDKIGLSVKHVQRRRWAFRSIGTEAFKDKRHNNAPVLLAKLQRDEVAVMLKTTTPNDHGYSNSEFWSTRILATVIKGKYGVAYASRTSYYILFKKASFSLHLPDKQYEKADPEIVAEWEKEQYQRISKAFSDPDTVVLRRDEMVLTKATTTQKVWIPKGTTPAVIETNGTRKNRSIYGFLNLKTGKEHAFSTMRQTMYETADILRKIRKLYPKQKILLLWDGAGWHRGSVAQEALVNYHIQAIHFPPYSPELNPQEHVWKQGRSEVTHNRFIPKIEPVTKELVDYLNTTTFPYSLLDFRSK
ncbi:MAG: IS630 family transposase [Actinobacteria bacterium]|nr:IS630 family transposase [Actinomycetota bacterium]